MKWYYEVNIGREKSQGAEFLRKVSVWMSRYIYIEENKFW